jgi:KAT8 regulatory NSL complex subunit 2
MRLKSDIVEASDTSDTDDTQVTPSSLQCGMDSDTESVDSEQEDLLKHAGVYTAEEVALIFRDKLIRLQSLYIDQFKRLHHVLAEKRRDYLHAKKHPSKKLSDVPQLLNKLETEDKNSLGNLAESTSDRDLHLEPEGRRKLGMKLVALKHYQRRFGVEALLQRKCKERRVAFSEGLTDVGDMLPTCHFVEDHNEKAKCQKPALPLSNHCLFHITHDPHQVLYTPCSSICTRPTACVSIQGLECELHARLGPVACRYNRREGVKEEHVDVVGVDAKGLDCNNETDTK